MAYLVEDGKHAHAMLDAVFAECHSRWGGRFSLVVPCKDGQPEPSFVPWLESFDPDILYSYVGVAGDAVARLRERLGPAFLLGHAPRGSDERDTRYFRPELPFAGLSALSVALQYARPFAPSSPQPIFVPDRFPNGAPDRFVDDNFGTPFESFQRWPLPDDIEDVVKPITVGTAEQLAQYRRGGAPLEMVPDAPALLRTMAQRRNVCGLAQLAADAPRLEIPGSDSQSFSLIIGDGFADRIRFWNERGFAPSYVGREVVTLIVAPARLEDPEFFAALVEFLKARNSARGANRSPWVKVKSLTLERPRLDQYRERLQAADRWNTYNVADPVTLEGIVPSGHALLAATGLVLMRGFEREPTWREFRVGGQSVRPPACEPAQLTGIQGRSAATQGLWALDLDIERSNNLSRYANETHRWRLPIRLPMHGAFRRAWSSGGIGAELRFARSSRDGFLVLYAGIVEDPPELTLPDDETAFRYALEHGNEWPHLSRGNESRALAGPYSWTRPSDKGRYLAGTLRLFGGLTSAVAYLLHGYWKAVFEDLGGATAGARHDEIKRTLRRRLRDSRLDGEAAWDRLAKLVASEAHRVRMPLGVLSYQDLSERHAPFLDRERERFPGSDTPDLQERVESAKRSLPKSVQSLCARGVLYQGYEWRCEACFHTNWNPIGHLIPGPRCEVCGEVQPAPVDRAWDFRLSGFVREALKEHGVLSLIWCLAQIHARVRESFFFLGPHELYPEYPRDAQASSHSEADLLCVADRRVHLCEVKSSDRDIDLESLIKNAKRLRPDVVTLAVMDAESPRLSSRFEELRAALAGSGVACELLTHSADAFEDDPFLPT